MPGACLQDHFIVDTIAAMRRFLVIVLILFLPLQAVWAAGDFCCDQEDFATMQHIDGVDQGDKASDTDADLAHPIACSDAQCSLCHLAGIGMAPNPSTLGTAPAASLSLPSSILLFSSQGPHRPERPKWALAV